ncbi:MAG: recombinase family protein [bacterium]
MTKAVIYARVSSLEQKKEGYSIPAQIQLLKEYAQKHNIQIVKEFTDSETAKQAGRTNFGEMLKFLKKNKNIKVILVEKTDRLYRNFKDYVSLDESNLEVHLVKENVILSENSKSHEKFVHGIKVLMAKNFIDNLSEEVRKGLQQKAEQGYYPQHPPYGYQRLDKKMHLINPETAPFVRRAFELYSEGDKSLEYVRAKLYEEGFIYKTNSPKIGKTHLERMLKNIFYKGQFKFNDRIFTGLHESLISVKLFEEVQKAFKKDNKPLYRNEHDFIFAGMITCSDCGCGITAEIKKERYIYYHCTWGKGKKNCNQKDYIRQEKLEEQFGEVVKRINITDEHKEWIIKALKLSLEEEQEYNTERINSLQKQTATLRDRIKKIYIDKLDGKINEEFWINQHNEWTDQLEKIKIIINAHDKANDSYLKSGIEILELANNVYNLYTSQESEEKAKLLKIILSNSELKDGKLSYTYKKPLDILAEGLSFKKSHA